MAFVHMYRSDPLSLDLTGMEQRGTTGGPVRRPSSSVLIGNGEPDVASPGVRPKVVVSKPKEMAGGWGYKHVLIAKHLDFLSLSLSLSPKPW